MPKFSGLFDTFDNLGQIDINSLLGWFKNAPPSPIQLEDYLANKILYPKTLPLTNFDMKIDLAILREALRINRPNLNKTEGPLLGGNPFLNVTLRKVIIPERFLLYVPDLVNLVWAFIDGLFLNRKKNDLFEDLWTVVVSGELVETVGSILLPEFPRLGERMNITLSGRQYRINSGSLTRVPCQKSRCEISYELTDGKILGKNSDAIEVYGGKLGLMVDGRMQ